MRVLVFAPAYAPAVKAGGPARSITNLVADLSGSHELVVVAPDRDLGDDTPFPGLSGRKVTRGDTTVYYLDARSLPQWRSLLGRISKDSYDLILINSLWNRPMGLVPAALVQFGVIKGPLVLMPRGELEPGALALKTGRKRVAGPMVRAMYRRIAAALGSTSASEASVLRDWFPSLPVLMTTNQPEAIDFGTPSFEAESLRVAVLGRVHPTKGLLPLLRGLTLTSMPISVMSYGPVEDSGYWEECSMIIESLPASANFRHLGMADREHIPQILWNSDCLALLTAGENYGHVIAEALQAGCPVITTTTTPWTEAIRGGGGAVIEDRDDAAEVAEVLEAWARSTPEELAGARKKARAAFARWEASSPSNIVEQALELLG